MTVENYILHTYIFMQHSWYLTFFGIWYLVLIFDIWLGGCWRLDFGKILLLFPNNSNNTIKFTVRDMLYVYSENIT